MAAVPVVAVVVAALLGLAASLAGIVVFIVVAFLMRHHKHVVQSDGEVKPLRLRLMSQLSNTSEQQPGNDGVIGTNLEQSHDRDSVNCDKKFAFDGPSDFV